jgi:hypothetical protein
MPGSHLLRSFSIFPGARDHQHCVAPRSQPLARAAVTVVIAAAVLVPGRRAVGQKEPSAGPVRSAPSIKETGQVAEARVAEPDVKIQGPHAIRPAGEVPVDKAAPPAEHPVAAEPSGRIDQMVLARQIRSRFAALGECPVEVARHHHQSRADAARGHLTLRWTILRTGRVADTAVVANSSVNQWVMDCVKRQMIGWSFTPPEGGTVRLERPFQFKTR